MDSLQEREHNHTAFRRLSDWINRTYPSGRFLAISGGKIVADAERFDAIRSTLSTLGKDPTQVLIVQAGVDYPESGVIFSHHVR